MGFFAKLFGTDPDSKLARAQRFMDSGEHHEARWILEGMDHPEAHNMLSLAMTGLVDGNLEEAQARFSSGDREGAEEHLALARNFGATSEQLRFARRDGRASMPAPKVKKVPKPSGPVGKDPIWSLPPDDPRLRYALMVESYPEGLRERLLTLGVTFAEAAMRTDNGDPEGAVKALTPFVEKDDVVRFERARAALATGSLPAAASDLMQFGDTVGHQRIGAHHTCVMMVQTLVQLGRAQEALDRIIPEIERSRTPNDQIMMRSAEAQLLFTLGHDEEADTKTATLLRESSRDMGLVKLLSRIRNRRGQRVNAMAVLEDGLNRCCSAPGKCGSQPLDLEAVRLLAGMYLEDRIEPKRAAELLKDLRKHRKQTTWGDAYLDALVARNEGSPSITERVTALEQGLAPNDPRRARLTAAFGQEMSA
jgi:hypothetical protein